MRNKSKYRHMELHETKNLLQSQRKQQNEKAKLRNRRYYLLNHVSDKGFFYTLRGITDFILY